jgi:hypothetical protein
MLKLASKQARSAINKNDKDKKYQARQHPDKKGSGKQDADPGNP